MAAGTKDVNARFRLQRPYADAAARFGILATTFREAKSRFNLTVASWTPPTIAPPTVVPSTYMHLSRLDHTSDVKIRHDPNLAERWSVPQTLVHFDGRSLPAHYSDEQEDHSWSIDVLSNPTKDGADQWDMLVSLLRNYRHETLLWLDHKGHEWYVVVSEVEVRYLKPSPFMRISFRLDAVDAP